MIFYYKIIKFLSKNNAQQKELKSEQIINNNFKSLIIFDKILLFIYNGKINIKEHKNDFT